jgi:hypothetical protein
MRARKPTARWIIPRNEPNTAIVINESIFGCVGASTDHLVIMLVTTRVTTALTPVGLTNEVRAALWLIR